MRLWPLLLVSTLASGQANPAPSLTPDETIALLLELDSRATIIIKQEKELDKADKLIRWWKAKSGCV
jgi:hypothetical protein